MFVDGGYTGKLIDWAKGMFRYDMEVVKRSEQHKFEVLPKLWIVERTFARLTGPDSSPKATNYGTDRPKQ